MGRLYRKNNAPAPVQFCPKPSSQILLHCLTKKFNNTISICIVNNDNNNNNIIIIIITIIIIIIITILRAESHLI